MNSFLIILLAFCGSALLVWAIVSLVGDLCFRYQSLVTARVEELSGRAKDDGNASLFTDLKQLDAQTAKARGTLRSRLQAIIDQSGVEIRLPQLLAISGVVAATSVFAAIVLTSQWLAGLIVLLPAAWIPIQFIRIKRNSRLRRLAGQLPETFDVLGRAVRAGQTVPAAIQLVADDFEPPISHEFRRCYEEQNLGIPYDTALRHLASRTGIMELRLLVAALLVQARAGGDLVELLTNLSTMVRKRIKLQQKVKTLTGEARLQALILIALPIIAFISLLILSPEYVGSLLARPWLLGVTIAAQGVGAVWIRRIVNTES